MINTTAWIEISDLVDQGLESSCYDAAEFSLEKVNQPPKMNGHPDMNLKENCDVNCQADFSAGHSQAICPDSEHIKDTELVNKPPSSLRDF